MPSFHLDTSYLIAYIQRKFVRVDEAVTASKVIGRLRSKGYDIRVCVVTVGEAINLILKKGSRVGARPDQLIWELYNELESRNLTLWLPERRHLGRITNIVNMVKRKDKHIDAMDVLIVAFSIADKECRGFLSFDRDVIQSRALKKLVEEHARDRKRFVITDWPDV